MRRTLLAIAHDRLPAGERRQRRGIGPQDARPETDGRNKWKFREGVKLGSREAALRSDHDGPGRGGIIGDARAAPRRSARAAPASAHSSRRRSAGQSASSFPKVTGAPHLGHGQPLALLGRFDRDRAAAARG